MLAQGHKLKYFARINKTTEGPFSLSELVEAGIRPSTYIWHKGLADWIQASEDPEVCRGMRRYLAGFNPETGELRVRENTVAPQQRDDTPVKGSMRIMLRNFPESDAQPDYSLKPTGVSAVMAFVMTICCFPVTGIMAVFFAMRCKANWKMSEQPDMDEKTRVAFRRKSHDDARLYRMMIGITFFIGLILMGVAFSRAFL